MTNKILRWFILMALFIWFLISCSEEIGPCIENEQRCAELQNKMKTAKTEAEKEQYYQFYLAEKHQLEYCQYQNR